MEGFPPYYDPERVGTLFHPDVEEIARQAEGAGLTPASQDLERVHLLIVDMQVDFCHEKGTLYVPGAIDDLRRLIGFIFRNAHAITDITCSLDSHLPHQIFHASWWTDISGNHPPPMTVISSEDVRDGRWRPVYQPDWSRTYVEKLERQAKKALMIWPYHVPIGGPGNALDPELWSAVFWHSIARSSQPTMWTKGSIPETEHYSLLQPEIAAPGHSGAGRRDDLLDMLRSRDRIYVAGEASSHCVLETLEDLVDQFGNEAGMLDRFFVLRDCMSPVRHPDIDFGRIADEAFGRFEKSGVRFVNSDQPVC